MEAIHQLSIESFSHGWLSEKKASSGRTDGEDGSSIDVDTDFFSMRWTDSSRFDFKLPSCEAPVLVHADQIFSNGHLLPLPLHLADPPKGEADPNSLNSVLTRSVSLDSSKTLLAQAYQWEDSASTTSSPARFLSHSMPLTRGDLKLGMPPPKRGTKAPGKALRKYLFFLLPLFRKLKSWRAISSRAVRSCGDSPRCGECRPFDAGAENSIQDAVLHCKKSMASSGVET